MFLVFRANYHNGSVSFDNFALVTNRFNRRSNFHFDILLIFGSPYDTSFGKIVRTHFYLNVVTF